MPLSQTAALSKDTRNASQPVMQHRHYAMIAGILRTFEFSNTTRFNNHEKDRAEIVTHFADCLASTNPNFDRTRFLRACGF